MIKKMVAIILSFTLIHIPVMAEEFFEFDIYDSFSVKSTDEAVLMEVDEDIKAEFEERLIAAWENMDTEVQLYPDIKIHRDDIVEYFSSVFFENPKYYYVVRSFGGTTNSAGYMGKLTKISYTEENMDAVRETWAEIDKATEEILFHIDGSMTDFEKVMTVHDYMDLHYVYDITDTDQTYLIMLDKKGVCAAYAEAFQHMMNVLGIESTLVSSDEMSHIWNMVKIDGRWYHADVTWDDPVPDQFAEVCHEYMLLSERAITELGHYGFNAPYYANSTIYNNAEWHDEMSALVTVGGVLYRMEGNNLIDEENTKIYENLDGGDGKWNITETASIKDNVFAGLCEINGVLYFNTDTGIYSYNPKTEEFVCVKEEAGICGLYADKNMIYYSTYDLNKQQFVKKGELEVCQSFVKEPYFEDGKAVIKVYNDYDEPIWIISRGDGYKLHKVEGKSIGIARFENGSEQTIYVWKNNLEPVVEKFTVSE